MIGPKFWIRETAGEIVDQVVIPNGDRSGDRYITDEQRMNLVEMTHAIIEKHQPLESGVAYMKVPRCEHCKYWERLRDRELFELFGDCHYNGEQITISATTREDFGCVMWERSVTKT